MTRDARFRRRVVPALACVGLAIGGGLAATALDGAHAATPKTPTPTVPKLTMTSAVTPTDAQVGTTLSYSTSLRNTGKLEIGASVADTLPDGVALVAVDADTGGSCTGGMPRITCTWATIPSGVTATAVYVVQVITAGTLVNGVEMTPSDPVNTLVTTTGTTPDPVVASEGVAVRFSPRAIQTNK